MSGATSSKSPTDRREWRQRPMAERIAYANKLLVLHPRFREAVALLERCHQSSKQTGEPICGAILRKWDWLRSGRSVPVPIFGDRMSARRVSWTITVVCIRRRCC